jgi:hypothetical protein
MLHGEHDGETPPLANSATGGPTAHGHAYFHAMKEVFTAAWIR